MNELVKHPFFSQKSTWTELGDSVTRRKSGRFIPSLLGRRVEVFFEIEDAWFAGYVANQGSDPNDDPSMPDGEEDVGWMIVFDDEDTKWMKTIRGNNLVRFIGNETALQPADPSPVLQRPSDATQSTEQLNAIDFFGDTDTGGSRINTRTRSTAVPHYTSETRVSELPRYSNAEQDRIKDAFRATTFQVLAMLPGTIRPGAVAAASQRHLSKNLALKGGPAPAHNSLKTRGLFQDYGYLPSEFALAADLASAERVGGHLKIAAVAGGVDERSGEPFFEPFASGHHAASRRLKHEANFAEPRRNFEQDRRGAQERACYPYVSGPYEAAKEARLTAKRVHEAKVLGNPTNTANQTAWVPSGKCSSRPSGLSGGSLSSCPTRKLLPAMVKELHGLLVEDWGNCNFTVHVDASDALVLRFELATVDSFAALLGYMNTLACDTSGALKGAQWFSKYCMRRAIEAWPRGGYGGNNSSPGSERSGSGQSRRRGAKRSGSSGRRKSSGSSSSHIDIFERGRGRGGASGGVAFSSSSSVASSPVSASSSMLRTVSEPPGWCAFVLLPPWHHRHTPGSTFQSLHPKAKSFLPTRSQNLDFKPTVSYGPSLLSRTTGIHVRGESSTGLSESRGMGSAFGFSPSESERAHAQSS